MFLWSPPVLCFVSSVVCPMSMSRVLSCYVFSAMLQVSVGYIVPEGAAALDGRLQPGDEILYIDSQCVVGESHRKVVTLVTQASTVGHVTLRIRRRLPGKGRYTDIPVLRLPWLQEQIKWNP